MISIGTVSDLHCGSDSGLLPPNFVNSSGALIGQNPVQAWLWDRWHHQCEMMWRTPMKAVVVNGDAVDGSQRKSGGYGVMPNIADQRKAAIDTIEHLLGGFASRPPVYVVRGTPYHVGNDGDTEESIADALRSEVWIGRGGGHRAKPILDLTIGKVKVNWAHHLAFSKVNASTPLGREVERAHKLARKTHTQPPDVLIRSHVHQRAVVDVDGVWAVSTPCWQVLSSHILKSDTFSVVDIGGVITWINPDEPRETRIECTPYPLPEFLFQSNVLPL